MIEMHRYVSNTLDRSTAGPAGRAETFTMTIDRELVGQFIDASVNDPKAALRLLSDFPALRDAHWNLEQTALHFLTVEGYTAAVELCLRHGFDPNATNEFGDTPLSDACVLGNIEIVQLLLAHGADPNVVSDTNDCPLHTSIRTGNSQLLDMLLTAGADPHYTTDLGESIFGNWPNDAAKQKLLAEVFAKHRVTKNEA